MNAKNTKTKSPIHENADANLTCEFGDGDISRSRKGDIYTGLWKLPWDTADVTSICERIIERRLTEDTNIGDEQFGFMSGRGTTDAIFAVRQLTEKHREKQK